jgi:predicted Zn-dependent protease
MGRTDNALEAYRWAAAGAPDAGVAQVRIVTALLAQGKAKEAGELADKMLGRSPADFDLLVLKARTLLAQDTPGGAAQAAGLLSGAIEAKAVRGRDTAAARLLLGNIYYRLGQMSTAENQLRRALSEDPTLLAARIALAKTLVANRAYEDAAVEANEVLRQDPSSADAYGVLGDVAISRGDADGAIANFRKALSLRHDRAVLLALVNVLKKTGKSAEGVAEIQAFLAADPRDADAARLLAAAYEDQGNLAGAEDMLKQLVAADGADAASVYALSRVYKSEGKLQEAQALLVASIKTNPAPLAYRLLAGVETLAGRPADAEATLREAVKRYGDYREAYDDLAALLATVGRSGEAIAVLRDGVAANRDKEAFYESLGSFYLAHNMQSDAEKFLRETAQANPKFVGVQLMLAGTYYAKGQKAEALAALETAVKFSPDDPRAANSLAYALAEDGADSQRAVKLASFAVTRMPESAGALDTLGWAYYRDGQFANAVASLSRAAASGVPSPPMLYHLTLAYAKVGAADRARETAQKLVALDGSYGQRQDVKEILSQQQ